MGVVVRSSKRLSGIAVAVLVGLIVGTVPVGLPEPTGGNDFPLAQTFRSMRAAWAALVADRPVTPSQGRGGPLDRGPVDSDATRANGGNGSPIPKVHGAVGETVIPDKAKRSEWTSPPSGFNAATSQLMTSESTATSDVYRNADGTYTRRIYSGRVNFKAADGSWQKIDSNLVRDADGRWKVGANSLGVSVAGFRPTARGVTASIDGNPELEARAQGTSTDLVSLRLPTGETLAYGLEGASVGQPVVSGPYATYTEVLPSTDLQLYTFDSGVKETIILNDAQAANSWVFPLRLSGLTPHLEADGSVALRNKAGVKVAAIPRGYMEDAKRDPVSGDGAYSDQVSYELVTVGGGPALKVTADRQWLNDPARVFPVRVDPTAVLASASTFAYSGWNGDNSSRPEIRIGTFNTTNAMGLLKFDSFSSVFMGAHITNVWLQMNVMWTGACPSSRATTVHVSDVGPWTPSGVTSWSARPALWGEMAAGPGYPDTTVCGNTSANPEVGSWWSFAMNTEAGWTTLNRWTSPGGVNNGLALTTTAPSGITNDTWMKISSVNTNKKPYLSVNYSPNAAPVVNAQYPATGYGSPTLTPELLVSATDADAGPSPMTYRFRVYDTAAPATPVDDSGYLPSRSYTVPSGKLAWGNTYVWSAEAFDGATSSFSSTMLNIMSTAVPQPLITSSLSQNAGHGFEPSIGNYTASATDAQITTVGPALTMQRSYNSRDPRIASAFGAGWSSVLDAKVTELKDASNTVITVIVRLPSGQEVAFGRRADGTFASPPGRYSNFTDLGNGTGYQLLDKDSTKYSFTKSLTGVFGLASVTDGQGRRLDLNYTGDQVTSMTSASGRKLYLTWTTGGTPHIATVYTDRAVASDATTVATWTYTYTGDKLTKVCPPTSTTACAVYAYGSGSLYPTAVIDAGPHTYLRFNEAAGATAALNTAVDNVDGGAGAYTGVTLGQTGPLPGSGATAAGFNGTSSTVELAGKVALSASYQSVSMWFKTTVKGGVLLGYSQDAISNPTTAATYTPSLYVGNTDGKLYGLFANGTTDPIAGPVVSDGLWHHVVLAAEGSTQTMYVDGSAVGTKAGLVAPAGADSKNHQYVGAGFIGGNWPQQANPGSANGFAKFFNGTISDFAFYTKPLSLSHVTMMRAMGLAASTPMTQVTRPSGGIAAKVVYDPVTGAVTQVTDENDGLWKINKPTVASASSAYVASVLGGGPTDYYRLKDIGATQVTNEVNGNAASYNVVTQGVTGGLFGDTTVSSFNGSSSYVQLPVQDAKPNGPNSVSMWFKTPAGSMTGGVLYSYQNAPVTDTAANWHVPAIYVGTDGRLRGQFWNSQMTPITGGFVNDGHWHHVALTATTNGQRLYLDGQPVNQNPLGGALASSPGTHAYIGAGKWAGWPSASGSPIGYFSGQIAEFAFYNSELSSGQIASQYGSRVRTAMWLGLDRGTGGGALDPVPTKLNDNCSDASLIFAAGDLTSDGKQDVICRASDMYLYLYRGDGAGGFVGGGLIVAPGQEWRFDGVDMLFGAGDFSGDGQNDVIGRGTDGNLYLYKGDGNGGWTGYGSQIGNGWEGFDALYSPGDFDGDGKPDVMARKPDGTLMLYRGNGAGSWLGAYTITTGQTNRDAVPTRGDFDSDGKPDYLYRDRTDKKLYMLRGNGTGGFISGTPTLVSAGWSEQDIIFSPGDFTGDGKADILFRSTTDVNNPGAGNGVASKTVKVTDPANKDLSYVYDLASGGRLVSRTDARGKMTRFGYDASGFLRTMIDPNGNLTVEEHDVRGNAISRTTCQDRSESKCSTQYFTYFPNDPAKRVLDPDPRNDKVLTARDGRSASATDNTYLTSYTYDAAGNLLEVMDPLGRKSKTEYTDGTTVAAVDGGFAPAGLPWRMTTPGGAVQTTSYFANGSIAQVVDPAGLTTSQTYDGLGRVLTHKAVSDTFPVGLATTVTYDKASLVMTVTDPPVVNRVTGATHTRKITNVYDLDGHLTSATATDLTGGDAERVVKQGFNTLGQLTSTTDPLNKSATFTYDLFGRKITETDRLGVTATYVYDAAGNLEQTTLNNWTGDPNFPTPAAPLPLETRSYDPAGRLASITDAMGWQTLYTYTDDNLPVTVVRKNPSSGTEYMVESNVYDAAGNLITRVANNGVATENITVDAASRPTQRTTDPAGVNRSTSYIYGADDTVLTVKMSDGTGAASYMDYTYDLAGRTLSQSIRMPGTGEPDSWWKLDDNYGTTALDSSAAARHGTFVGGVSWAEGGVKFDGTNLNNIFTTSPVLDTTASFTVSTWVKVPAGGGGVVVAQDGAWRSAFELTGGAGGNWGANKPCGDANWGAIWLDSGAPVVVDKWTHVTLVFDTGAGNTLSIYVDGAYKATGTNCGAGFSGNGAFTIGRGRYNNAPEGVFKGSIDNVQAYRRAASAADIASLYGKGRSGGALGSSPSTSQVIDQRGAPKSQTDPNGNVTYYDYDAAGHLSSATLPSVSAEENGGAAVSVNPVSYTGYNTFGEQTEAKDPKGRVTVAARDANGLITSVTLPSYTPPGGVAVVPTAKTVYDNGGRAIQTEDPLGRKTNTVYDQLGRIAKVTAPDTGVTKYTYNLLGGQLSATGPTGARVEATYDYLGRKVTATQIVRQPTTQAFTTNYAYLDGPGTYKPGWLASVTPPSGTGATTYQYNNAGEVKTVVLGGNSTQYDYDFVGRPVAKTAPDGSKETIVLDAAGQPTTRKRLEAGTGNLLSQTSATYDANGQLLTSKDAMGTTSTFTYNAVGSLTQTVQPITSTDSIVSTFGYDVAGARTRFTDGRGSSFITTYNSLGLPESVIEPATSAYPNAADRTFTTVYDAAGQAKELHSPGGVKATYSYNAMSRVTTAVGTGAEVTTADRTYDYDLAGRLTSVSGNGGSNTLTYDDRGLPLTVNGPSGSSTFSWNSNGQMASRADAAGTTSYIYDAIGRLDTATNSTAGLAAKYGYNEMSQVSMITYGSSGNRREMGYDKLHRLTTDELKTSAGATIGKITYGWDLNNNETSKITVGFNGSASNTYTYDLANRLTQWKNVSTGATTDYTYDKAGNRTRNGAKTFVYDERNHLASASDGTTYQYTARGTLKNTRVGTVDIATMADAFNQVTRQHSSATQFTEYTYDGLGRAIKNGFSYTGTGNTLAGDGTSTYVRGPDGDLIGGKTGTATTYAWTDLHRDVVGQFTATGTALTGSTTYEPLGTVAATTGMSGSLGYQSEFTDSLTKRVNMHSRWYNSDTGQFDTRDTQTNSPVPESANANRFAYVNGNPLTGIDPTGHMRPLEDRENLPRNQSCDNGTPSTRSASCPPLEIYRSPAKLPTVDTDHKCSTSQGSASCREKQQKPSCPHSPHIMLDNCTEVSAFNGCYIDGQYLGQLDPNFCTDTAINIDKACAAYEACQDPTVKRQIIALELEGAAAKAAESQVALEEAIAKAKCDASWGCRNAGWIGTVAGIVAGAIAGAVCLAVTAGAGSIGCAFIAGFVGGFVGSLTTGMLEGQKGAELWGGALINGVIGGVIGVLTLGAGAALGAGVRGLLRTGGGKAAGAFAANAARAASQKVAASAVGRGLASLRSVASNVEAKVGSCTMGAAGEIGLGLALMHSFDPDTKVLMADGEAKPIKDVAVGDKVVATDPETGQTTEQPVTVLHANVDVELTDVTVVTAPVGASAPETGVRVGKGNGTTRGPTAASSTATLHTTAHHPFWDATTDEWVDAAKLVPGESTLAGRDGQSYQVVAVHNFTGAKDMRDLTVATVHTYYVVAGDTPVLVHNCGTTDFYTVQGADDAARLGSGGHPFPTSPERAHFGPGVYAWGNHADALAYAANKPGAQIMKFTVDNKTLAGLNQTHIGGMSDDAATAFMERNSLLWGGDAGHGLDYISRPTARGTEHFFSSNIFDILGF